MTPYSWSASSHTITLSPKHETVLFAECRLMVQSIEFTKGTIFCSALAALSSLRDLSKATSILSDPSKVPEQALRASTARDPTDLASMMAPPGATGENRDNGALGGFSWNSQLVLPRKVKEEAAIMALGIQLWPLSPKDVPTASTVQENELAEKLRRWQSRKAQH